MRPRLQGRIFAFPSGKGSTVGSYLIYGLAKAGNGPAGIVNARTEAIVAVGATLAGIPLVDRVDVGGLRTGDRMTVDGDRGTVELPDAPRSLYVAPTRGVRLEGENAEHRGIGRGDLPRSDRVPRLSEVVATVLGRPSDGAG